MHELETKFFIPIAQSKDSDVFEPKPLPWLVLFCFISLHEHIGEYVLVLTLALAIIKIEHLG